MAGKVNVSVGEWRQWNPLPVLGMRIVKTVAAVAICLGINMLIGYSDIISEAIIAAIVCMQPVLHDTRTYARNRLLGTALGAIFGLVYLLIMNRIPYATTHMWFAYFFMVIGVLAVMYTLVVMKSPDAVSLAAIVFICIVITFPDVDAPITNAIGRVLFTALGTVVAIGVNLFHLPRSRRDNQLFFVRIQDLSQDRYAPLPMKVVLYLRYFFENGIQICLISRWAPAFVMSQLSELKVNTPVIVMDGAALYDPMENRYLEVIEIPREDLAHLHLYLDTLELTWCEYAVHDNQTMFIYMQGPRTDIMHREYDIMKRAPYRSYRFGNYEETDHFTTVQVLDSVERIDEVEPKIRAYVPESLFRIERRVHPTQPGCASLYFYTPAASVDAMKKRLVNHIEGGTDLVQLDVGLRGRPATERNTERMLHKLRRLAMKIDWKKPLQNVRKIK